MEIAVDAPVLPLNIEGLLLLMALGLVLLILGARWWDKERTRRLRRMAVSGVLACLAFIVVRASIAEPFVVPTPSMAPTLLEGDLILVQKYAYGWQLPIVNRVVLKTSAVRRGDIVVFTLPDGTPTHYVKRVLGVGGDDVLRIEDRWFINGVELSGQDLAPFSDVRGGVAAQQRMQQVVLLPDRRMQILASDPSEHAGAAHWVVPPGELFLLGDHRGASQDSRFFGTVPEERVLGRVVRILWNDQGMDRWWLALEVPR